MYHLKFTHENEQQQQERKKINKNKIATKITLKKNIDTLPVRGGAYQEKWLKHFKKMLSYVKNSVDHTVALYDITHI